MDELQAAIRKNPRAAQAMDEAKSVIEALHELRKAGIARGSELSPFRGRQSLGQLKRNGKIPDKSKLVSA